MSQKRNRRTVIKFNKTYKVTFEVSKLQVLFNEFIESINELLLDRKFLTVFPKAVVIKRTENKARRF